MNASHWHCPIALPTLHGKQAIMAAVLEPATGCKVVHVADVDTDRFGTFTREVARTGNQLEAARAKARAGQGLARSPDELLQLARELGFPEHRLCLRPDHSEDERVIKGLGTADELLQAFSAALAQSTRGQVFAESDLRAHCNPTRQAMIRRATEDLCNKMLSTCPTCGAPGFALSGHRPGRPCRLCASATREPLAHLWSCPVCHHNEERRDGLPALADPARCDRCNP